MSIEGEIKRKIFWDKMNSAKFLNCYAYKIKKLIEFVCLLKYM